MRIEYVANRMRGDVKDSIGEVLIKRGLARQVYETRELKPEDETDEVVGEVVQSKRSKRYYRRRDMQAQT